ncbi:MAG: hypothetical protein IPH20_09465 [Bacteroidales bacterium]|nr:hypothetical protein [Bacteroidales bacterium]
MKKTILMIIVAFSMSYARAQVTVALGSALEVESGTKVSIPLTVTGLDAANGGIPIIAAEFHVFYSNLNAEYDTTSNFSGITPASEWSFGSSGTEYGTSWIDDNLLPVSFPDGTVLFEIVFDYFGGIANLDLDSVRCYLVDANTTNIPVAIVIDGVITPSAGSEQSVWNGDGDWNTSENWSNGVPGLNTIAVIASGNLQILSNANCKSLLVNNGSIVRVMPGFAFTVSEGIENNGSFIVESDESGTGSVISNGNTSGTGSYTTEQYVDFSSKEAHLVSSPLNNLSPAIFNESTAVWQNLSESDMLQNAGGVRISSSVAPVTMVYNGPFNSQSVSANLSYTSSNDLEFRGLNLMGNPFPSSLVADLSLWTKTGSSNSVYVWDGYKFRYWNGKTGNLADGLIPAMQGFFVRADQSGASIEIPGTARVHSNAEFYKESNLDVQNQLIFRFEKKDDPDHFDEAYIHVFEGSVNNYSSESDVIKLMGNPDYPQVFSKSADNITLAVNTQPGTDNSIPITLKAGNSGEYKLTVSGIETVNNEIPLYLEDTQDAASIWNIRITPSISFNLTENEITNNRYVLHFKSVGIDELPADYFKVYASNGFIHIESERQRFIEQTELYSVAGSLLGSFDNITTPSVIRAEECSGGIAILKIRTAEGIFTKKVLLLN